MTDGIDGRTEFGFTFGASHTQSIWSDARMASWPKIVEMLTSHMPGPKEGACIVPAIFSGDKRKKEEATKIDVAFLDSDSGATLDEITNAIKARGWEAVVSSTHSHMSTVTTVARSNWDRFFANHPDASAEDFLVEDKGYLRTVAAGAAADECGDEQISIHHAPCPKFRIALPLSKPWLASEYQSQGDANVAWKDRIEALANALSLSHDQACTDTSRLFYLPRKPPNGAIPETAVTGGVWCDIFSLASPKAEKPQPKKRTEAAENLEYVDPITGEFIDLASWVRDSGKSFLIGKALKARKPGKLTGLVVDNCKVHIDCPNIGAHTNAGRDSATFVINSTTDKGFVIHCRHSHCTGKDRLVFLRTMLEEKWLEIEDLTSPAYHLATEALENLEATSLATLDLDHIPPRRWLYGRELVRGYVSVLASPGGTGKTAYTMVVGTSIAWNRPLLSPLSANKVPDDCIVHKQGSVWFYNLEDPMEEMRRRIKATLQHHRVPISDVAARIYIDSGRDRPLIVAIRAQNGDLIASPIVDLLVAELKRRAIDVLVVDPFVQSHSAEENRNEEMNLVMALWGKVAHQANCAVWLVHHFRKGGKGGDAESIRGAGAIQGAARSMFTVSSMSPEEADKLGIPDDQRWQYIRHDNAKQNMAPPVGHATWYRLASVSLNNGNADYPDGDFVQAVESWVPPSPWDGLSWAMIERVLSRIDRGPSEGEFYSSSKLSRDRWSGHILIDEASLSDGQATTVLKAWKESGLLEDGQYSSPRQKGGLTGCVRVNQAKFAEMKQAAQPRNSTDE